MRVGRPEPNDRPHPSAHPCRVMPPSRNAEIVQTAPPSVPGWPGWPECGGVQMTETTSGGGSEQVAGHQRMLGLLLAAAMFVLVVDTSLMNVSISAVVRDLDTTVSGVQSAIALEALVSAAFILIGGKVGDLIGRKRAYVLGLLGYAIGALAMALAQSLTAVIIFWAVLGGIGASLLLPAMQSLIHGNFDGAARTQVYALVGAAAAIAAAVGPLLGGFITTFLSWRVGFVLEVVIIAVVLCGIKLVRDVAYTGTPDHRRRRRAAFRTGHGRARAGHPGVAGGRRIRGRTPGHRCDRHGRAGVLAGTAQACREADADRPRSVHLQAVQVRDLRTDAPADRPGRRHDRAADLSADGAGVQRAAGRSVPRPALAEHVRRGGAGREEGRTAPPCQHHPAGIRASHRRHRGVDPDRAPRRVRLGAPRPVTDRGIGAGLVGVAAQQLHAVPDLG